MKIVNASYAIEECPGREKRMRLLERAARTCYKSEGEITAGSAERIIASVLKRGHESVIEHASITVRFVVDRGISHELVRHRLASFSQESTRYVRYDGDCNEGNELTFISPCFWSRDEVRAGCPVTRWERWLRAMQVAEEYYLLLLEDGAKPEEARSVLPNSLKTEIVVTANLREWRYILRLRTSDRAHPQMREVMVPLRVELQDRLPAVFGGTPCASRRG